jgi:leucyl aminopeptidase
MKIKIIKSEKKIPTGVFVIDLIKNKEEDYLLKMIVDNTPLSHYKTGTPDVFQQQIFAVISNDELDIQRIQSISMGIIYAKQIASFPPNLFYPLKLAQHLRELSSLGIEVEVLDAKMLKKIGMHALLAAGQGSKHAPDVAIHTWPLIKSKAPHIVLVGKGVTFDSGGLCLKNAADQKVMKMDKSGAGVVAGVLKALASLQYPQPVIGILGFLENMPDGGAVKPGDVIRTLSSKTVEIVDTDAEGRLLLADCLTYGIETYSPSVIVDIGTLTKETSASLGAECAGLYTNDDALKQSLLRASEASKELLWPLPMGPYFAKQIASDIADMQNCGLDDCGENGACAEFLKAFVGTTKWAHIDLSQASWNEKKATGFGVRCLTTWIEQM